MSIFSPLYVQRTVQRFVCDTRLMKPDPCYQRDGQPTKVNVTHAQITHQGQAI